jgi:hypothetical protein
MNTRKQQPDKGTDPSDHLLEGVELESSVATPACGHNRNLVAYLLAEQQNLTLIISADRSTGFRAVKAATMHT